MPSFKVIHEVESTPLKQSQHKVNIITFMRGEFIAGLLYWAALDCISFSLLCLINCQLSVCADDCHEWIVMVPASFLWGNKVFFLGDKYCFPVKELI